MSRFDTLQDIVPFAFPFSFFLGRTKELVFQNLHTHRAAGEF
jgi:hypothetical protein